MIDELRAQFLAPGPAARPTPLYWWSGADLSREKLTWQLDELAAQGIGGTIVGYAHLPNVQLDHGAPTPLSDEWWELFRWFVEASAARGLSVGCQDYGIIGSVLLEAGERMPSLGGGMLRNITEHVTGPAVIDRPADELLVLSRNALEAAGSRSLAPEEGPDGAIRWQIPSGEWILSTVIVEHGEIAGASSAFDPLHSESGSLAIDIFYERFARELGEHLGSTFTTFFQDELDFGIVMPMWNELVGDALAAAGWPPSHWLHAIWHELGEGTLAFRALYRDTVVELLEKHYFEPIFDWHERHSTQMVMDQLSRGDLRLGRAHYGDFLETMKWYQGPGNDDPDLTGPRSVSAFKVSASIAHLHGRPLITSEAFHSSGWGVTPHDVISGMNIGFACGVNQLILHGLNYTTDGGWWEWASPDFHFRQPWWAHSAPLWDYVARVSTVLRAGEAVSDVAVLDPTQEIDLGVESDSLEVARQTLEVLMRAGINADLVPQTLVAASIVKHDDSASSISVGLASYRAVVVPAMSIIREDAAAALADFARGGGIVIALSSLPTATELRALTADDVGGWQLTTMTDLAGLLQSLMPVALEISAPDVMFAHRRVGDHDLYFLVNAGDSAASAELRFRDDGRRERWEPWTGTTAEALQGPLHLEPGESTILIVDRMVDRGSARSFPPTSLASPGVIRSLDGGWQATPRPATLDNRFGDFLVGATQLAVSSFHVESSRDSTGPWSPALVGHGTRFWALGPIDPDHIDDLDVRLPQLSSDGLAASLVDIDGASWRPYRFSFAEGLDGDAYLQDRMTGPHGLKGVPDEFLDPRVLDDEPPAGSAYYFLSSVESCGGLETMTSLGRCRHQVWVDGVTVVADTDETPAAFYPPWGLRDMSATPVQTVMELTAGRSVVLVKVVVSADQPTRAAVVVGGRRPAHTGRARSPWWQGSEPAHEFVTDVPGDVPGDMLSWIRVKVPAGARSATLSSSADVVEPCWAGHPAIPVAITARPGSVRIDRPDAAQEPGGYLAFAVRGGARPRDDHDAGAIRSAIEWETASESVELDDWVGLGLADFSGIVVYEREFDLDAMELDGLELDALNLDGLDLDGLDQRDEVWLRLEDLHGSAKIFVNDTDVGTILMPYQSVSLTHALIPGSNRLRIEVANTLENLFSRLPSPFTVMQKPGGGFRRALLQFRMNHLNAGISR